MLSFLQQQRMNILKEKENLLKLLDYKYSSYIRTLLQQKIGISTTIMKTYDEIINTINDEMNTIKCSNINPNIYIPSTSNNRTPKIKKESNISNLNNNIPSLTGNTLNHNIDRKRNSKSVPKVTKLLMRKVNLKCKQCNVLFDNHKEFKSHMQINHNISTAYKCDKCDKYFKDQHYLSAHIRTTHMKHGNIKQIKQKRITKINLQQCKQCGKMLKSKSNLKRHMRTHTGYKPYSCDICGKAFCQSGTLTVHRRTHTGEKPYKCDICNKSFGTSGTLKNHQRIHTGERPYQCELCLKRFTQAGSLSTHLQCYCKGKKG
eukprot:41749_1